jgi:hypothetical protein
MVSQRVDDWQAKCKKGGHMELRSSLELLDQVERYTADDPGLKHGFVVK